VRTLNETDLERLRTAVNSIKDFPPIADALPQLVWTARADGTIEYFNRRWSEYTGHRLDDAVGNGRVGDVVHPDDLDEMWSRWKASVATGAPYEMEYRLRGAADHSYRWFLSRAVPLYDEEGKISRWIGTATDIDERLRSRDRLSFMVEAGSVFAPSYDVDAVCEVLAELTVGHVANWAFVTLARDGAFVNAAVAHENPELVKHVKELAERYSTRPQDPLAHVISENKPLLVKRVSAEDLVAAARDPEDLRVLRLLKMHSLMLVPLTTLEGKVYGALGIVSAEPGRLFNGVDLDVAMAVAARAAIAIEHAQVLAHERLTSQRLRVVARANELLFETADFWTAMAPIAELISAEIADGCAVLRLSGDALRVEIAVHRDPAIDAAVARLLGQRAFHPKAEFELAVRLKNRQMLVRNPDDPGLMMAHVWPYLAEGIAALNSKSTVIVPLHSVSTTYGALVVSYSERNYDAEADLPLLAEVAARASLAAERAETLARERRIATTLQQALLPSVIPRAAGLLFDAVYLPAEDEGGVGGDWYDAIELDDGSVVVSVGDVTGRGIQAAAIMSKVRHAMGMAPRHEADPAKILDSAEWFLRKRYPDAIVTAFVAVISPDRRTLRFANAGHLPPILRRGDELVDLHASGLPLGLRHLAVTDSSQSVELRDGDRLILYTDGLIEWNRDWEEGERRLREVAGSSAILASTEVAKLIERACLPRKPRDDVAILTVTVGKGPIWSFTAEDARAAADVRGIFVNFLRDHTGDPALVRRAELIFGELLGNVVRHAPGPVEIELYDDNEGAPVLHVIDSGPPFGFDHRLPNDVFSELGRGLFIIHKVAKHVRVEHIRGCGNHISVVL
jgi:PAS domain S-box-containing protein